MQRKQLLALFFLTGISALIYEICWVRQGTLIFGVSIYAYSAVLTAYMGGMAIGNYWFGKRADKSENLLHLFLILQIALAVLGVLALFALDGLMNLYASLASEISFELPALTILRLGFALLAMTPPAVCIGAMMPVMSRVYARRSGQIGYDVGQVYVVSTLGSVLGCSLAAIYFIRWFGLRETVFLAAIINLGIAAILWIGDKKWTLLAQSNRTKKSARHSDGLKPSKIASRFLLWAYAISGFAALGYEIVWARIISVHTVGAIYSFSIMLTVFLAGLVLGGIAGARWARRRVVTVSHFGFLEMGIGLLALMALLVFSQLPKMRLENFFAEYSVGAQILFEGLLSFITLFPATILIGAVFPLVSSLYTAESVEQVGLKIGHVTALNTVGSILGSLLTGFVILPALGLQRSTFTLAILNIGIGLVAIWLFGSARLRVRLVPMTVLVIVILLGTILPPAKYLGYWEDTKDQLIFYKEGVETTVAVFEAGPNNPKFSTVNGRVEVPTDVLSMRAFYLLGHLPPLLRPDAQNALMLSFGNGIASGAMSTHEVSTIEVVELAPEMVTAAQVYTEENRHILAYPGLRVHVEDARNYLPQTDQQFDIITTDATHPSNSSSWTLFTAEFYEQIKEHLAPEGIFLQWVPIHSISIDDYLSILRTFQHVFPTATMWYTGGSHTLLLATPNELTPETLESALTAVYDAPMAVEDLGGPEQIMRHWIMNSEQLREFAGDGKIVHDNDAFFLPVNAEMQKLIQVIQMVAIRANP